MEFTTKTKQITRRYFEFWSINSLYFIHSNKIVQVENVNTVKILQILNEQ